MKIKSLSLLLCLILFLCAFVSCSNDKQPQSETPAADETPDIDSDKIIDFEIVPEPSGNEAVMLPAQELRIVSMNLSTELREMDKRGPMMVELLNSYQPDSIGTQENSGYSEWVEVLNEGLPNYKHVGICGDGQEDSRTINSNYIYYNADKYECLDWYTFWPSETTTIIASCYAPTYPRTCTWAILQDKETGFKYVHINCHLAFEIEEENIFQISIIRDLMVAFSQLGMPVFTTGDFNTGEGSFSYELITAVPEIDDPKHLAARTMSASSFRGWEDRDISGGRPIDFCFVTGDKMTVHQYEVIDTFISGVAVTDHCGIFTHVTVNSLNDQFENKVPLSTDGITLTELSCTPYHYDFSFTQVDDISYIHEYHVELTDSDGNLVDERNIPSKHLDVSVDASKRCTFTSLEPGSDYTVKLYAESLIGTRSDPIVFSFTTPELSKAGY